jgi:hypothetical protein
MVGLISKNFHFTQSLSIFVKLNITFIENIIIYLSIFSGLVPVLMIFILKKYELSLKIICFYSIYGIISDLILSKLSIKYFGTEIYSYRLFTVIEFVSLSLFIYFSIETVKFKKIILLTFILFFVGIIIDFFTSSLNQFDSLPSGIESLLILNSALLLLYEKVLNESTSNKNTSPIIITSGIIIFFSGTFFLFILSQKNYTDTNFSNSYGYLVAFFNIIKNIFIILGIINYKIIIPNSKNNLQHI